MKKPDIAKRMARDAGVSHAEAADRLDGAVRRILADLKRGLETSVPGLGSFRHGAGGKVEFVPEKGGRRD